MPRAWCFRLECDAHPQEACAKLEQILGPASIVVRSGGRWTDPQTGERSDKLHLHWRLAEPATGKGLALLKRARTLATRLVGGDPSNVPIVHPIRGPAPGTVRASRGYARSKPPIPTARSF